MNKLKSSASHYSLQTPSHILKAWTPTTKTEESENVFMLLDVIDKYWTDCNAKSLANKLNSLKNKDLKVIINSAGGDLIEGLAMYNLLKAHDGSVNIEIIGLAASAASIIALAGDTITMHAGSEIMIHDCWGFFAGNTEDLNEAITAMERYNNSMSEIYADETGLSADEVRELMKNETYFTADEAIEKGFATQKVIKSEKRETDPHLAALRLTESALKAQGLSRSEIRETLKNFGKQNATEKIEDVKPCANELDQLLAQANELKTLI